MLFFSRLKCCLAIFRLLIGFDYFQVAESSRKASFQLKAKDSPEKKLAFFLSGWYIFAPDFAFRFEAAQSAQIFYSKKGNDEQNKESLFNFILRSVNRLDERFGTKT